jgi:putative ABC transport system substrate-binding protein
LVLFRPNVCSANLKSAIRNSQCAILSGALLFALSILGALLLALSFPAEAQQSKKFSRLGLLSSTFSRSFSFFDAFFDELRRFGHIEGQNLIIEFRTAEGRTERLPELATDIIRSKVDLVVAPGPAVTLRAVTQATKDVPVVMVAIDYDPIALGYVATLARPGGNVTGVFFRQLDLTQKRVELLKETFPKVSRLAIFWDPLSGDQLKDAELRAKSLGMEIKSLQLGNPSYDIESAFKLATQGRAGALLVLASPIFFREKMRLVELAIKHRLPAMYANTENVEAGGLMAYGPNYPDLFRRAATYGDKILKGSKPADLPVEQPTKFELFINLKTAKQMGIIVPPNVLARADKVIK